ncbi:MAG TPA: hypothetical protein VIP11_12070 [Gemmatimonadaceae bacterium]
MTRRTAKKKPRTQSRKKQTGVDGSFMVSPLNGARCPTGAHPGNTGGKPGRSGRPASEVREACLLAFDERIPRLAMIADGIVNFTQACPKCGHTEATPPLPVTEVSDMRAAIDQLGKYGLGERSEFSGDVVAANVDAMLQLAQSLMSADDFVTYCHQADEVWNRGKR